MSAISIIANRIALASPPSYLERVASLSTIDFSIYGLYDTTIRRFLSYNLSSTTAVS